jgi:hypothetical protein
MNGKRLAAEAIGTFWLTFGGCGSAVRDMFAVLSVGCWPGGVVPLNEGADLIPAGACGDVRYGESIFGGATARFSLPAPSALCRRIRTARDAQY